MPFFMLIIGLMVIYIAKVTFFFHIIYDDS